jgi:hypothetical protein
LDFFYLRKEGHGLGEGARVKGERGGGGGVKGGRGGERGMEGWRE